MKRCTTCQELKDPEEFNRRSSAPDGRQPRCRDCCRSWYAANRVEHKRRTAARSAAVRHDLRIRLTAYLEAHPCVDCGESDLRCLDLDHRPGEAKAGDIAAMISSAYSWDTVLAEIAKCDVRCANCHRRVTAERGGFWRQSAQLAAEQARATRAAARVQRLLGAPPLS